MSVIEKTLKKLQGSLAGVSPARSATGYGPAARSGAAERRERAPDGATPQRIVALDQETLLAAGMLPPAQQERELAQQFRRIKRPLINNALGRGVEPVARGNVLMITSAVPGEGKTFMSLNLAFSIVLEADVTVLLVDGDVVNPRISQILGLESELGLLDVVQDPAIPVESAILSTDVPGLAILPAGRQVPNTTELLASSRMHEVVSKLCSEDSARLVLFDSAPLLVTTESQALAQFAGQLLVVVQADQTPQHVVFDALASLSEGKSVSLVLNQSTRHSHSGYYYEYGTGAKAHEQTGSS